MAEYGHTVTANEEDRDGFDAELTESKNQPKRQTHKKKQDGGRLEKKKLTEEVADCSPK